MAPNSGERWLISRILIPVSCQFMNSRFAWSITSSNSAPGPGEKLNARLLLSTDSAAFVSASSNVQCSIGISTHSCMKTVSNQVHSKLITNGKCIAES
eukprot:1309463-Pyramimonas_sp.AAC.2